MQTVRNVESDGAHNVIWGLPEDEEGENIKIIYVTVINGKNLAKKDIFGLSDPYCVIQLLEKTNVTKLIQSVQTGVKKKTLNPVWKTSFLMRVDTEKDVLLFQIFDENRLTRDDFLGEAEVKLDNLYTEDDPDAEANSTDQYTLSGRSHKSRVRGTISVQVLLVGNNAESASESPVTDLGDGIQAVHVARDLSRLRSQDTVCSASIEPSSEALDTREDHPHPHADDSSTSNPLPPNWEQRQDANGRIFYVNHNTRTTTWVRPTSEETTNNIAIPGSPEISRDFELRRHISQEDALIDTPFELISADEVGDDPLPPGWEARRNINARTLYINHNNRTTTWVRPRIQRTNETEVNANPSAPPLPDITVVENSSAPPVAEPVITPPTPSPAAPVNRTAPSASERLHPEVASQSESPLPAGWAMQLAPNGRVFFIDHNTRRTSWVDPRTNRVNSADDGLGPLPSGWEQRTHSDGRIFFIDHATQSTQWEDPRLQSKAKEKAEALPYSRDYKRKYDYLKSRLKAPENVPNKYEIHVRRKDLLEDSFRFVYSQCKNIELLKTKLWIVFDGETGLDYGGVSREWFYLLSKEIFNPYYGLFEYSATDNYTLQINPNSARCNDQHLVYYKFIGRVAGMAVYHGKLLDAFFIRPFYKMLLEKKITLQDLESVDSEYHNSLKWLLENDPEILDLTFIIEEDVFGECVTQELKPQGSTIPVTKHNVSEYINLVIKWRFIDRVRDQMKAFAEGFHDLIPHNLVQMFDERELEYLLCGLGEINVDDWRLNTQYRSGYHDKHVVIQWFWKAVTTFDNEMKARLLQFVTGTSRVPMNGFAELYGSNGPQKFAIERWGNSNQLPRSHTCFNRLDLPPYLSYHELREKLRLAIENTEGFEGVD